MARAKAPCSLVTGILEPTEGQITLRGQVASLLELGAGFHPDLTGRENIFLNGSVYGFAQADAGRLESIIDFAELGDFIDTPVKHYSSGMYVRLGFSVAIHTDPDVLIVDEVLTVGDQVFQQKCLERIYDMKRAGVAIILVSHSLADVQRLCDRAIWLTRGWCAPTVRPSAWWTSTWPTPTTGTTSSAASARWRSRPTSSPSRPHPSAGAPATR
ncbi:MAG: ABC transporter ATP-binding protein [Caldilineaceae bacterium]